MIKTQLRLPDEVKVWVEQEAARSERSQNAQIIWALRQQMAANAAQTQCEETGASVSQTSAPVPAPTRSGSDD